jgi:hypothetical protein
MCTLWCGAVPKGSRTGLVVNLFKAGASRDSTGSTDSTVEQGITVRQLLLQHLTSNSWHMFSSILTPRLMQPVPMRIPEKLRHPPTFVHSGSSHHSGRRATCPAAMPLSSMLRKRTTLCPMPPASTTCATKECKANFPRGNHAMYTYAPAASLTVALYQSHVLLSEELHKDARCPLSCMKSS